MRIIIEVITLTSPTPTYVARTRMGETRWGHKLTHELSLAWKFDYLPEAQDVAKCFPKTHECFFIELPNPIRE